MNARERIRQKIHERGLSMGDLSKNVLGRNHAYLQQYLERGVPAKLATIAVFVLVGWGALAGLTYRHEHMAGVAEISAQSKAPGR